MKISTFFPFFILFVTPLIGCQFSPNGNQNNTSNFNSGDTKSTEVDGIQKNTKRILTTTWTMYGCYEDGKIDLNKTYYTRKFKYNEEGKELEYSLSNNSSWSDSEPPQMKIVERTTSSYENGMKTEETTFDIENKVSKRQIFTYNSSNQIDELLHYLDGTNPNVKYHFVYNNSGKLVEKQLLTFPTITEEINGQWVERFSPIPKFDSKIIYTYDSKNNLIDESEYDDKGKMESRIVYENDENGNPTKISEYNSKGITKVTRNVYKSNLLVDEQIQSFNPSNPNTPTNVEHNSNKYNEDGKIIEKIEYTDNGTTPNHIWKVSYEYF